jgi:hypothetical protein
MTIYVTIEEQIAELRDEINMRDRTYPHAVAAGRWSQQKANAKIGAMKAALATLERISASVREAELRRAGG